jgi:hypothetical protein
MPKTVETSEKLKASAVHIPVVKLKSRVIQ